MGRGSHRSTRRGTSQRRPSTTRRCRCTWRSTAGSPATWRRSGSRCGVGRVPVQRTPSGWIVQVDPSEPETVTVFGDCHLEGLYSQAAARRILARGQELPCRGRLDTVPPGPGELGPDRDRADGVRRVRTGLRPPGPGPLADPPGARRPGPARGPARSVLPADPPAVRPAQGGVPELRPQADHRRRLAG